MNGTNRGKLPLSFVGMAVLGFVWVVCLLIVIAPGELLRKSFLVEFDVVNRSGQKVYVTVLGVDAGDNIAVLPQVGSKEHPVRYRFPKESVLSSGETRTVTYDWDDINFTWIAVRDEVGPWKIIRTGLPIIDRTANGSRSFSKPDQRAYVIPPLKELPNAPANVEAIAAERKEVS